MVILEALAAGCPVIASENVPDLPACVKTAQLGDRDSWNAAIAEPITENLEDFISNHLIENVRGLWGEIYDKIIDSNASTE